jgi:AcrR family transcriptional regulator
MYVNICEEPVHLRRTGGGPVPAPDGREPAIVWMRPVREPRGQHPPLTRDKIAATAIAVADAEGIGAVSMRRVAAELGCGTMSLYRHVRDKDELLDVMIDAGIGEASVPPAEVGGDWRADLRRDAHSMRAAILRHPWVAEIIGRRPAFGPNMLATTEAALSAVDGLGLSIDEMLRAIGVVNAFVVGFVINELAERKWRYPLADRSGPQARTWASVMIPYVRSIAASGQYPRLTRAIIEAEDFPDPAAVFEWQLDRVLDGLAAIIPSARKPEPG